MNKKEHPETAASQSDPEIRRVFLGLHQPPLVSVVEWLIANRRRESVLDLKDHLLVLPSQRARIRLLQLLVSHAEQQDLLFTPPTITTVGNLPEYLYVAEKQLASDLAQSVAWSKALEQTPADEIANLTGRKEYEDLDDWQPLGKLLSKLHQRLGNDVLSFRSVAREVKKIDNFPEIARWDVLQKVQDRYYTLLKQVDLWDRQAARNVAVRQGLCSTDRQIVLIGTADLNRAASGMLRQVPANVSVMIAADKLIADRFDDLGCLITETWLDVPVDLNDDQILIVDQPADQAFAAASYLTNLDEPVSADEITIGTPDPNVVPQLERSLNAIGVKHRNLAGRSLSETSPVRLMKACGEYLDAQNYDSFAALIRHPDLFEWLGETAKGKDWIQRLDEFQNVSLPESIDISSRMPFGDPRQIVLDYPENDPGAERRAKRQADTVQVLNEIHGKVAGLLLPLNLEAQAFALWTLPWSEVLLEVYGQRVLNKTNLRDREIIVACEQIHRSLGDQRQVPDEWQTQVSAGQALEMAIQAATEVRVVPDPEPDAIEFAGWLDLALDDAPVMVVTGMNNEFVPAAEVGHQFLPNSLCEKLQIMDNDRRYARDTYALTVIRSVRSRLLLIVGRRDEKGEPRRPSRLLFATENDVAARRAKAFFGFDGKPESRVWLGDLENCTASQEFEIPLPECTTALTGMAVTGFREYLKCPYRFYLTKVLRLESIADDWRELDGGAFGTLAHDVLEKFALDDIRDSLDAEEIGQFLSNTLDLIAGQRYSGSRLPAVQIQIQQIRMRLLQFAGLQSQLRHDGWKVASAEESLNHELMVDGEPFTIRGKIDRVDINENSGAVAVWDYKTSDKGDGPHTTHFSPKHGWKDLQLPLYRHLIKEVEAVKDHDLSRVQLGYIVLPKKIDDVKVELAYWNAEQLHDADQKAFEIIRKLRSCSYWPPKEIPPDYSEQFAAICQDFVFEKFPVDYSSEQELADGGVSV